MESLGREIRKSGEELMSFYAIRLKNWPDKFIGKTSCTYAVSSDGKIAERLKRLGNKKEETIGVNCGWFVPKERCKIWNSEKQLMNFVKRCDKNQIVYTIMPYEVTHLGGSYSEYEIVEFDGETLKVKDLVL